MSSLHVDTLLMKYERLISDTDGLPAGCDGAESAAAITVY